jgi:hypothetical protein
MVYRRTGSAVDLGAMAIATTYCVFVLWAFGFLRLTTAGFTAQAFGAGDGGEIKAIFWRACLLAGGFGLGLVLFALSLGGWGLELFGAPAETRAIAHLLACVVALRRPCRLCSHGLAAGSEGAPGPGMGFPQCAQYRALPAHVVGVEGSSGNGAGVHRDRPAGMVLVVLMQRKTAASGASSSTRACSVDAGQSRRLPAQSC